MSSDTFVVSVISVHGDEVVFETQCTTAGGMSDVVCTRSFVLMVLDEALGLGLGGSVTDRAWVAEHVGDFVRSTAVERIVGLMGGEREIRPLMDGWGIAPQLVMPKVTLRAKLASADLATRCAGVSGHGTTAWDVWWDDPLRPALPKATPPEKLFPADASFPAAVAGEMARLLPGWAKKTKTRLDLVGEAATLSVDITMHKLKVIGGSLNGQIAVRSPRVDALVSGGGKKKSIKLLWDVLSTYPSMHAGYAAAEIARRFAEILLSHEAALKALLTMDALVDYVEHCAATAVAQSGDKALQRDFVSFARGPAQSAGFALQPEYDDRFWVRVPLLDAAGRTEEARRALAFVSARWKRPPKDLVEHIQTVASGASAR